ncbi:MAG: cytochrome c3 family protein [Nitrospirae bacterium]|nr:cytochrome c3 family protein [Nitrospirota bacterium]
MKKVMILMFVIALLAVSTAAFAVVSTSRHNLTSTQIDPNAPQTADIAASVCGFCHIPHGGDTTITGVPLWARDLSAIAGAFVVYGGTLPGNQGATLATTVVDQPGANSLTCLSCHDGVQGLGVTYKNGIVTSGFAMTANPGTLIGGANNLSYTGYATNPAYMAGGARPGYNPAIGGLSGVDLTNDHPVGIVYTDAAPNIAGLAAVGAVPAALRLYNYGPGANNRVECGTCHDPHDQTNGSFLRRPAADLCVDCHSLK